MDDLIRRHDAIDALWKALYEYEDKTEKQFQESEDLDVGDWILHRVFVQNMSDIDRQTILNLPFAQQWIPCSERPPETDDVYLVTVHPDYVPQGCKQVDRMYYFKGKWRWLNEKAKWEIWPDPIIAWMPLPEPYEAETEE